MVNPFLPNIASSALEVVLDKLANFMLKEISLLFNAIDAMKKLERTLLWVQTILHNMEINQRVWQTCLGDLRDAAYEADDLLDEILILASQNGAHDNHQVRASSSELPSYISWVPHKIDILQKKINGIAEEMNNMNQFIGSAEVKGKERLETTSLMYDPYVIGRDMEIVELINLLVDNQSIMDNVSVISIVGMAGIGKTTVAQFAYNDQRVYGHFQLRMWVSVHQEFGARKLTRSIIESATHRVTELRDLNSLQIMLRRELAGKRFLLVLDDVWSESYSAWNALQEPLRVGAHGSIILVTTRSRIVSKIMNSTHVISLSTLTYENSWLLFERTAFRNRNLDIHPNIVRIGWEIVRKCEGLPLAVNVLGGLLNSVVDEDEWNIVLRNNIWDFPEEESDILPALMLSYQYLPGHLKQCFAYCSIFPKGYMFDKEKLVLLWIAEGFVQAKSGRSMEDVGREYFDKLVSRSILQDGEETVRGYSRYKMHDLIHDMAIYVSNHDHFRMEDDMGSPYISRSIRHLSFLDGSVSANMFDVLCQYPSLRTILLFCEQRRLIREVPFLLFDKLGCLRVLDLSITRIRELPSSIRNLKHLRYLDLSETLICTLPRYVRHLYGLQTLRLRGCSQLIGLPNEMSNLINLRHLDLERSSRMNSLPVGIGKLTSLQTLNSFIVGTENGCNIGGLKDMKNLQTLCILKLENATNTEVTLAALHNKKNLRKLKLKWSDEAQDDNVVQQVLAGLKPHENIKELVIEFYGGSLFPGWICDPSFSTLVNLSLCSCSNCQHLPTLGQLPSLKSLRIADMDGLTHVDQSFCGAELGFPLLETLELDSLAGFTGWDLREGDISCLRQLTISRCPNLATLRIVHFRFLQHFKISHCSLFHQLPHDVVPMSLRSFMVNSCPILRSWYEGEGSNSLQVLAQNRQVMIDDILYA